MRTRTFLIMLASIAALAAVPANAAAQALRVTTDSDEIAEPACPATYAHPCTLRQATWQNHLDGGGDTIMPYPGVTLLTSPIAIEDPVTLLGIDSPEQTVIDANGNTNAFTLSSLLGRQAITFKDITIQGSNGGPAIETSEIEPLTLDGVILRANRNLTDFTETGDGGAGLEVDSGVVNIVHSTIEDNLSANYGGGIAMLGGELTIDDSELRGNMTLSHYASGGAISLANASRLTIERSRLDNNGAWRGGAIATLGHQELLLVKDSTFDANAAVDRGGAIDVGYDSYSNVSVDTSATITNSTFVENEGPYGSALGGELSHLALRNSVLADNFGVNVGTTVTSGDCGSMLTPLVSLGHNVADDMTCGIHSTGDSQGIDPKLGLVIYNGGPTASAMPFRGSPLIDAGDRSFCSLTDQRGVARMGSSCDIGAVESPYLRVADAVATPPATTTTTTAPPAPRVGLIVSRVDLPSVVRSDTAAVTWQASAPGSVRFTVQSRSRGRWVAEAHFTLSATAGRNRRTIPRAALRQLDPGRYRLVADPQGAGAATTTMFRYSPRRSPAS
jgi:hypothetical protein